jgi:MshEN domain
MFENLRPAQPADEVPAYDVGGASPSDEASPAGIHEQRATDSPMRRPRPSLASLMAEEGIATKEQLEEALAEGQQTGERLGEVVLRRGWTTEAALANLIARQWDLTFIARSLIAVDNEAQARLSREVARELGVCPVSASDGTQLVAVADPSEERFGAVREALNGTCTFVVTTPSALAQLIDELPETGAAWSQVNVAESPDFAVAPAPAVPDTEAEIEPHPDLALVAAQVTPAAVEPDNDPSPVLDELDRLLNRLVSERVRTSDELAGHRRRLDELAEEQARVEESVRSLEDKLGQDEQLLESMRTKLAGLT